MKTIISIVIIFIFISSTYCENKKEDKADSSGITIVELLRDADESKGFTKLEDAVELIASCVEKDDYDKLKNHVVERNKEFFKKITFDALKALNAKTPLRKLYSEKAFPKDKTNFTLGGCGEEWNYLHVMLAKKASKWHIIFIGLCS